MRRGQGLRLDFSEKNRPAPCLVQQEKLTPVAPQNFPTSRPVTPFEMNALMPLS
jgi:hypothetical protein